MNNAVDSFSRQTDSTKHVSFGMALMSDDTIKQIQEATELSKTLNEIYDIPNEQISDELYKKASDLIAKAGKNKHITNLLLTPVGEDKKLPIMKVLRIDNKRLDLDMIEALKTQPKALAKMLTQTNKYSHNAFMHAILYNRPEVTDAMIEALKTQPEALATMLTQNNRNAFMIAVLYNRPKSAKAMIEALKDQPEALATMLTQPDKDGHNAFRIVIILNRPKVAKAMIKALKDQPQVLVKMLTQPDKDGKNSIQSAAINAYERRSKIKNIIVDAVIELASGTKEIPVNDSIELINIVKNVKDNDVTLSENPYEKCDNYNKLDAILTVLQEQQKDEENKLS